MYELIANISVTNRPADIFVNIWEFRIPLKIICFNWLCLSNRVHTWDNLIKKGWIGPNWYCQCRSASESVDHLFHECSFTRLVTSHIGSSLAIPFFWKETNFILDVSSWISKGNNLKYLPLLLSWQIWLTRNKCVFEDKQPNIFHVVHSIRNQLRLYRVTNQQKHKRRTIALALILDFLVGFFDGASTNRMGGRGVHLLLSQDHYFCFKLGVGLSSNTRSELLALWTLLHCAKIMGLPTLHIHGDSAVINNWFNRRSALTLLTLNGWCHHIRELEPYFIQLIAIHIYR